MASTEPGSDSAPASGETAPVDASGNAGEDGKSHRPSEGFLFIVTYGRSGSTILMNVLNSLPGVLIRGENAHACRHLRQIVEKVLGDKNFYRRRLAAQPEEEGWPLLRKDLGTPRDPWYGAELVTVDGVGQALAGAFIDSFLCLPPDTRIAGFKEVRYLDHCDEIGRDLDFLRRFFPRARFVFLTRDHRAVMASGMYAKVSPFVMAPKLRAADAAFRAYADAHPEVCHLLRYEDFARNTDGLRPLFAFLDEPFDAARIEEVLDRQLTHVKAPAPKLWRRRLRNAVRRQLSGLPPEEWAPLD